MASQRRARLLLRRPRLLKLQGRLRALLRMLLLDHGFLPHLRARCALRPAPTNNTDADDNADGDATPTTAQ